MTQALGRYSYLVHLLAWGVPVIAVQAVMLARWHRAHLGALFRTLAVPVAVATVWLTAADHVAISHGVWFFGQGLHLGVYLGAVPIEEALFFLITNSLVALGMALFSNPWGRRTPPPEPTP